MVLPVNNLTLLDLAKSVDPNGNQAKIIEMQSRTEEFLIDANFIQGNLTTGHRAVLRTGLPASSLRMFNQFTPASNGNEAQVDFNTTMADTWLQADKALVDMASNPTQFIASKSVAHLESLAQRVSKTMLYGNPLLNPAECQGFMYYYNSLSAESAETIVNAGGSGSDNASIIYCGWGDETLTGIVPKNAPTGIQINDYGDETATDSSGNMMRVRRLQMNQYFGLANLDHRYSGRIVNIDRSALAAAPLTAYDLPDLMFSLLERVKDTNMARGTFYMDKSIREALRKQLANRTSDSTLKYEEVGGIRTAFFQGKPVRVTEALRVNEAAVV